jgi:hypothetical protein
VGSDPRPAAAARAPLLLEQGQVDRHGRERVLDLVREAGGDAGEELVLLGRRVRGRGSLARGEFAFRSGLVHGFVRLGRANEGG